jgi:chromosome segregation ATPase
MQEQPPTRAEFNELKHRFDQLERETEPIRLERRLSIPEANTLQAIMDMVGRQGPDIAILKGNVSTLKTDIEGVKADIKAIKESQADFRDALKTAKDDITSIKATQEQQSKRQDTMDSKLDQILTLLQQKLGE